MLRQDKKGLPPGVRQPPYLALPLPEGFAVGALIHRRVAFVGAHMDLLQRAVVLIFAVVGAGTDGAFNALVDVIVHIEFLLFLCATPHNCVCGHQRIFCPNISV